MGGSAKEPHPCKYHYDISMSKRTRKPRVNLEGAEDYSRSVVHEKGGLEEIVDKVCDRQGEENDHMSWKELISSITDKEEYTKEVKKAGDKEKHDDYGKPGRNSLGQHFTEEEKQLQLVTKQKQGLVQGLKFKGMMGHYVKVLSHFVKVKHAEPYKTGNNIRPRKKPALLRLGM